MNKTHISRTDCQRQAQKGLSLIELLIAMAIGLFLLLGLGLIFQSLSQNSSVQTQLSQLQDNERMAMTLLTTIVQEAGYFDNTAAGQWAIPASTALPSSGSFNAGQSLYGTHVSNNAPGDSLSIRFSTQSGDNVVNCQGVSNAGAAQVTTNRFYVATVNGSPSLMCSVSVNGGAATTQPLISGVENLQVLYGIDSQTSGSIDTYMTAAQLSAAEWSKVRSVQITLTFTNPLYVAGVGNGQPQTITLTRTIQVMNQT